MKYIFINSDTPLLVDRISVGEILPASMEPQVIALKILRTATLEEYLAWVAEQKLEHMIHRETIGDQFFYYAEVLD